MPLYSDLEAIQDSGGASFSDAPKEAGGVDDFRRDFSATSRNHSSGVFGRSPELQREEVVESEPLTPDDALQVLGTSFELRQRLRDTEDALETATEENLDTLGFYTELGSREDYSDAADSLLQAGGGSRMEALLWRWQEQDPDGAAEWLSSREYAATVAAAQTGAQAMRAAQHEVTSAFAEQLADYYRAHPEYEHGTAKNLMLAQILAGDPSIGASPESFRRGLEAAREVVEDVSGAALRAANEISFRKQFQQEALRHSPMRPPTQEHLAEMAARPIGPSSFGELGADIAARTNGTPAQRQAALQARDAEIRAQFAEHSRSKFAEGNREGAARALKARSEERQGLRAPNRGF
jgi:hypothetical protein